MKAILLFSATFAALGLPFAADLAADAPKPGTITGVVRFTGTVPPPQKVVTSDGTILMHNDLVVDAKSKGLKFVAVYLQDAPAQKVAKDAKPVVVDQRDMVFIPRVVVAQEGQTVRFENNDICNHAVSAVSTKTDNVFNVLTPMGQPFDFRFQAQKAPVQIGCPIHGWMRAWVFVLPHPYAAVTDAQGKFTITGVAAGKHTLIFAHPDGGSRETREVTVQAGAKNEVIVEWSKTAK